MATQFEQVRLPSFSYPGGKVRMRSFVTQYFPRSGKTYVEPFAGLGNVFFYARKHLDFRDWWLNDLNSHGFFQALIDVDYDSLPEDVDRDKFLSLKKDRENPVSKVLEPRVSYAGKGYDYGYMGSHDTHVGYKKSNYVPHLHSARRMIDGVKITKTSWDLLPYNQFDASDFVYFDPPYLGTRIGTYGNIEHDRLLEVIKPAKFRWVLSGYDSDLYRSVLGPPTGTRERAAEIAATNGKVGERRVECVWASNNLS